jgi:Tol biopolymer transport system component
MLKSEGLRITTIAAALLMALVAALVLWGARPAEGAFLGDNGRITFTRDPVDSNNEIYMMDSNGNNQTRLTNNGDVFDSNPTFSPSGTRIAFDSFRDGNDNIYVMSASDTNGDGNGENVKRLTKKPASDTEPAFSASGTKIAFVSDRSNLGGSPDIFVMKAKPEGRTNRPKNLTRNSAYDYEPSFSPDGTKIVFTSNRDDANGEDIYVMNSDGTGVTRLTSNPAFDFNASFSPDGNQIVFGSERAVGDTGGEVFVMDAVDADNDGEGDNMRDISNSSAHDGSAVFSPDGTKIAFRSNRSIAAGDPSTTDSEIFVVNAADGLGLTQLTRNDVADNRTDWGPLP